MAGFDHVLQLRDRICRRVGRLRRKIISRPVSPVIHVLGRRGKLVHRHTVDLIDPQFQHIGDLLHKAGKCSLVFYPGGCVLCKPSHMEAVSHHSVHGNAGYSVPLPVIVIHVKHSSDLAVPGVAYIVELLRTSQLPGIGIHEDLLTDPVVVLVLLCREICKGQKAHVPGLFSIGHIKAKCRLRLPFSVQQKLTRLPLGRLHCKIHLLPFHFRT